MINRCKICNVELKPLKKKINNFQKCSKCGLLYFLDAKSIQYDDNYFNSEYRNQYGTSYIDDKEKIQKRLLQRYDIFKKYVKSNANENINLLEMGSAAGFFLSLMKEKGFKVQGWEISEFMSEYANANKVPTQCGDLIDLYKNWKQSKENRYDIVSAFYVLEHIPDQAFIWKIFQNVTSAKGLLLLAMPSYSGPGFFFNREKWINNHPKDHFVDYNPSSLKKVAMIHGFKPLFFRSEGIHSERFPLGNKAGFKLLYNTLQKKIPFSDTIFAGFIKNDNA